MAERVTVPVNGGRGGGPARHVERVRLLARLADAVVVLRFDPELVPRARDQVVDDGLSRVLGRLGLCERTPFNSINYVTVTTA